jgi:hypothetical protein
MFSCKGYLFSNIVGTRPSVAGDEPQAVSKTYPVRIGLLTAFDGNAFSQNNPKYRETGHGYLPGKGLFTIVVFHFAGSFKATEFIKKQ